MKNHMTLLATFSAALSMTTTASPALAQEGPEPVLPPASGDFVSTTVASIEDTPLFYIAANDLMNTMNLYKTTRESGDCSLEINQTLRDAKAMADAARVNEWNSFTRLQKDYVHYARTNSGASAHFADRINNSNRGEIAAATIFASAEINYPTYLVFYQVFSQADSLYCNKDGTPRVAPPSP